VKPIERIHAYLLHDAQLWFDVSVPIPPFVWFRRDGAPEEQVNVAMPAVPIHDGIADAVATLRAATAELGWLPRIEFPEAYSPTLPALLEAAGLVVSDRRPLLTCTPESLRPSPDVSGLQIIMLTHASSLRDLREGLDTNALGFNPQAPRSTDEGAEQFRRQLFAARAFTARLAGEPVGAGMYTAPYDGVTQLAGITTLAPYRRLGIASALTSYMTRSAFEHGVDLTFLTAANEVASRVYQRVGYAHNGAFVTYVDAPAVR
jgi:ribosomal protein S18 acetylase RimI-like enzyme